MLCCPWMRPDKGVDEFEIYYYKVRTEGTYKWRLTLTAVKGSSTEVMKNSAPNVKVDVLTDSQ